MTHRFSFIVICGTLLWCALAYPSLSRAADEAADAGGVVWTAIIPDAFPRFVYTWRMGPDGTYREDGRDGRTGTAIQATLSGHWSVDGAHMVLRQQDLPYVFDGVVLGGLYSGTLYFNGRAISRFCAAKGDAAPDHCSAGPGVAETPRSVLPLPSMPGDGGLLRRAS